MHIDAFHGTSQYASLHDVCEYFGGDWLPKRIRHNGYRHVITNGDVIVFYDGGAEGMGIHVQIQGAEAGRHEAFLRSFRFVPTRLDLAQDTDQFDLGWIAEQVRAGRIAIRARVNNCKWIGEGLHRVESMLGVGSRKNNKDGCYVRVYDKALEQGLDGQVWTRMEWEFRGVMAQAMWHRRDLWKETCMSYFRVLKRKYADMTKATCKLAERFALAMDGVWAGAEKVRVVKDKSLAATMKHFKQLLPTIKAALASNPQLFAEWSMCEAKAEKIQRYRVGYRKTLTGRDSWYSDFCAQVSSLLNCGRSGMLSIQ